MSIRVLIGDVRDKLKDLPDDYFDCVVTSPPYWGLRSYLPDNHPNKRFEIGLEPSLGEHLDALVDVFREVRRVLKPAGTLWVNYGDCYATTPNGRSADDQKALGTDDRTFRDKPFSTVGPIRRKNESGVSAKLDKPMDTTGPIRRDPRFRRRLVEEGQEGRWGGGNNPAGPIFQKGNSVSRGPRGDGSPVPADGRVVAGGYLKPKDLCMIPARLAIALQEDGWFLRKEIIWHKENPMPESVIDRPTTSHEKIFMFAKSCNKPRVWRARDTHEFVFEKPDLSELAYKPDGSPMVDAKGNPKKRWRSLDYFYDNRACQQPAARPGDGGPFGGKKAQENPPQEGDPRWRQGGGQWGNEFQSGEFSNLRDVWSIPTQGYKEAHFATFPPEIPKRCILLGCPVGGRVLDPFGGAGTTALVADRLGRQAVIVDLNDEYAAMATRRINADTPLFPAVQEPEEPPDARSALQTA